MVSLLHTPTPLPCLGGEQLTCRDDELAVGEEEEEAEHVVGDGGEIVTRRGD